MNETRFDGKGKIYAKYRPTYPQEFIDYLCSDVGISNDSTIADIGSGTGILTKQLLNLDSKVYAVEPNSDMRAVAEAGLSHCSNFVSVNSTAENTTLDANSVDFITVAQAFHWFDRELFKDECCRIIRQGGKVILVWNSLTFDAEIVVDGDSIHKKYCPDFEGRGGDARGKDGVNLPFGEFFSGKYGEMVFENSSTSDMNEFIGRYLSSSYAVKENDENYPAYIAELTECFYKHAVDGKVVIPIVTRSYVGEV